MKNETNNAKNVQIFHLPINISTNMDININPTEVLTNTLQLVQTLNLREPHFLKDLYSLHDDATYLNGRFPLKQQSSYNIVM